MNKDEKLTPDECGEPRTILERGMPAEVLKSTKKLKQEQRARANMFDLNSVEGEQQTYQSELVKLGVILAAGLALFSWLTGWH